MCTEQPAVYVIEHEASGKRYVGSAANVSKRWSRHRLSLETGTHPNAHLQAAWTKYGAAAFRWWLVAIVEPSYRIELEQRCMDAWQVCDPVRGYNRATVAGVSYGGGGRAWTPEQRQASAEQQRAIKDAARHRPGAICPYGHVKDGSYTQQRVGRTGIVTEKVRCQECERTRARERARRRAAARRAARG